MTKKKQEQQHPNFHDECLGLLTVINCIDQERDLGLSPLFGDFEKRFGKLDTKLRPEISDYVNDILGAP